MSHIFSKLLDEGIQQQQQLKSVAVSKAVVKAEPIFDSTTARQQPVMTARQHDSMTAPPLDKLTNYLLAFLEAKATQKTTLRYPQSLMDEIDEVLYQIKKTHGVVISKNAIFVLSLAYVLADFKRHASHSLLFKELINNPKK